jgi:hypothetical protein
MFHKLLKDFYLGKTEVRPVSIVKLSKVVVQNMGGVSIPMHCVLMICTP